MRMAELYERMKKKTPEEEAAVLEHYGVKGQKWGVRRSDAQLQKAPGTPPSDDHAKAVALRAQLRAHGTRSLSNAELKSVIERMNLEQQYSNLSTQHSTVTRGKNKVKRILDVAMLANTTLQTIQTFKKLVS